MINRRQFFKKSSVSLIGSTLFPHLILGNNKTIKITILHTNDMHSHIHPFKSGRNKGLGGMAQRATLIQKIRQNEKNVLLLDAGDIFQGTPYFNFYGGELELKLMSIMNYDAATLGNHDFDNGLKGLKRQLKHAKFPFLTANYDFSNTILQNTFNPYKTFNKGGVKIGVFGLGIKLDGLVPKKLFGETVYKNPIKTANHYALILKEEEKCDLIICLSHLGLKYKTNKVSDIKLAQNTKNIDLIIGGHTHTFLKKPLIEKNKQNKDVLINQVGWGGINIGKIDFHFQQNKQKRSIKTASIFVKNNSKNN